eukprot:Skav233785  [mRNA]  locus=scaffold780:261404:263620:- [translate_table: standard]
MHSMQGMIFPEAIMIARWLKPKVMLLENVVGLRQHEHYGFLIRTIQHVGYKVLWSGVTDLNLQCPIKRPRWLAILVRVDDDSIQELPMQLMSAISATNPILYKSVVYDDLIDYAILGISNEVRNILSKPQFAPGFKRQRVAPEAVFASRCYTGWQVLPCFLASYGSQHNMVSDTEDRTCLTHLAVIGDSAPRYWHPLEVCLHHQAHGFILLPRHVQEGWKAMGNQIATPHAAMLIHNALRMLLPDSWSHTMDDILTRMHESRIDTSNMHIQNTPAGIWISKQANRAPTLTEQQQQNITQLLHEYGSSFMPAGKWWDIDGFHDMHTGHTIPSQDISQVTIGSQTHEVTDEVPATLPMPIYLAVLIEREVGHSTAWALSDVQPTCLAQLWRGLMGVAPSEVDPDQEDDTHVVKLVPSSNRTAQEETQRLTACWLEGSLLIQATTQDRHVLGQLREHVVQQDFYDAFGLMDETLKTHRCFFCCDFLIRYMTSCTEVPLILAAFQLVTVNFVYDVKADHWKICIRGDPVEVATLVTFYSHAIHPDDLLRLGRTYAIHSSEGETTICYIPVDSRAPIPPLALEQVLSVAATRSLMGKLQSENPREITLKWYGRPLWHGCVDSSTTAEMLEALLQVSLAPFSAFGQQRLIVLGKRFLGKLCDFPWGNSDRPLCIHLVEEMCGGGGPTTHGSKNHHRQQVKNSIASTLLEQGVELSWVHENVDQMITKVGIARVVPVASQPRSNP